MPTIPNGVLVAWPFSAASIPAGWSRDTQFDAKFVQGAPASGNADFTARGNADHTHTSGHHTPGFNTHTHTLTAGANDFGTLYGAGFVPISLFDHTHPGAATDSMVGGSNNSSTVAFTANSSNNPPFKEVIWIKSDGSPTGVPPSAYAFFSGDSLPSGWTRVQGDKYLKGAAAAGDGGATGGAATHTHTSNSHTHTQTSHTHGAVISSVNGPASPTDFADVGGSSGADNTHGHTLSVSATTVTNQALSNTTSAESLDPVFKKLNTISNDNASASLHVGVICLWGGTHAGIPTDWARLTAMDAFFLKGAASDGESNVTTGGSATHTHTATCQPIQNSHTHTGVSDGGASLTNAYGGFSGVSAAEAHTHIWDAGTTTGTNAQVTYNVDASSSEAHYPAYVRAIYISYSPIVFGTSTTTNANDTSSASAREVFVATTTTTNANDTPNATAKEVFTGTSTTTNANDTSNASAREVFVATTTTTTNANDTSSATAKEVFTGTSTPTNANDTSNASAREVFVATSTTTNANDTSSATATEAFIATATPTNANDTSNATAKVVYVATSVTTNANDASNATATVVSTTILGTSATTNANDTSNATAKVVYVSTSTTTNANDASASSTTVHNIDRREDITVGGRIFYITAQDRAYGNASENRHTHRTVDSRGFIITSPRREYVVNAIS